MAVDAVSRQDVASRIGLATEDVLTVRNCFKVVRIDAITNTAQVVDHQAVGDRTLVQFI